MSINPKRVRLLVNAKKRGLVVYWLSRDQCIRDNWALLFAQELALKGEAPMAVVFCLIPEFLGATIRQFRFMLLRLKETEKRLRGLKIPFFVLEGNPAGKILEFLSDQSVSALVTDFDPLRIKRNWREPPGFSY